MSHGQQPGTTAARPSTGALVGAVAAVVLPLGLLVALRARPELDLAWQHHPAHFWLVLGASVLATTLGHAVTLAARKRHDARLLLISLAFLSGAGFLGLHALATPGVLVGPNAGFEFATPIGLALGSVLVALSSLELPPATARWLVARSRTLVGALAALLVAWAAVSLARIPPLDEPVDAEALYGWQLAFAAVGAVGYGIGAWGYLRLYRRRGSRFGFLVAVAFALLAVAMVIIAFAVNWRISWWEWHVVMLAAFALISLAARQEWHEERFSALYLERTLAGTTDASILFADLQGFTSYSERTDPATVQRMLNTYLTRVVPLMQEYGGEVHQLIGDAVMVLFNAHGQQPDHARQAARAALAFQRAAAEIAGDGAGAGSEGGAGVDHAGVDGGGDGAAAGGAAAGGAASSELPRFRVGVNTGEVATGVLGDRGHRKFDVIGDTVNLAARLESQAPVGRVLIGEGTRARLPADAVVEPLEPLEVKGKAEPVTAYLLRAMPD